MEINNDSVVPWIGKTGKMLGSLINKSLRDNGILLTREQFIILKVLSEDNGKPQQDLAFITESDKTSLSRLISNMEKSNLIERKSIKEDKRVKHVYITTKGKSILETTTPIFQSVITKLESGISKNEIELTINTLKKIQFNINKEYKFKL